MRSTFLWRSVQEAPLFIWTPSLNKHSCIIQRIYKHDQVNCILLDISYLEYLRPLLYNAPTNRTFFHQRISDSSSCFRDIAMWIFVTDRGGIVYSNSWMLGLFCFEDKQGKIELLSQNGCWMAEFCNIAEVADVCCGRQLLWEVWLLLKWEREARAMKRNLPPCVEAQREWVRWSCKWPFYRE